LICIDNCEHTGCDKEIQQACLLIYQHTVDEDIKKDQNFSAKMAEIKDSMCLQDVKSLDTFDTRKVPLLTTRSSAVTKNEARALIYKYS